MEIIGLLTIGLPFLGAILILFASEQSAKWICQFFAVLATLGTWGLSYLFFSTGGEAVSVPLLHVGHVLIFGLVFDKVSTLIAVAVVGLGLIVAFYSLGYMSAGNKEHAQHGAKRYYVFLLIFIGAMAGLVFSSTILGQLLFFEITGACSWSLIGYYQTPLAFRSALKALIVTHIASLGLFIAAATLFVQAGTFELTAIAGLNPIAKMVVLFGIMFAAWGKSAQLPMHMWLPDAMNAPTPISAYLHAASMVKVGVYIFARSILSAGTIPEVVGIVGIVGAMITMIYGFLMYLPQKDMKRLLAYSTITQLAYIFLALSMAAMGSSLALESGVAYIFNHAFAKCLFFFVAGSFSYACGTRMLPQLKGVIRKSPLLGVAFCIAAMAIAGVPPLNGFFSKFPLFEAGFHLSATHAWLTPLLILALVESIATFGWLLYWFGRTIIGEPSEAVERMSPLPSSMKITLVVLIAMSVLSSVIASTWLQ
ncbi:hydrogenase 4 subunit D [Vibrio gazogenes]|uniref:Hydrogenase-4 component D n=1 Tax=Vibrio gazogenes DSM 21264 = NBRC 103151 TaxID=1123492 RepID=A0A1M4ZW25_VIBGA|nr:hydrogenase 4 subunit D [Vibrio gazogenes]USP13441.1 hydrogenase 4 subunit D [Vibrio gazogenes]SHF22185.1 hydrogenase-4 component D [Vibrio gazogenes DSM 21264] [Vibrio gazogenes DSM 21264 = NBRC 103151]SJN57228.1 NADH-quinone oxidoreductase subunit L [Vibrio gazogenes]